MTSVVVVGAGAIGAYVGARLEKGGADVTLVARGAHLEALKRDGLTIESNGEIEVSRPRVMDNLRGISTADVVFLGVKSYGVPPIADSLGRELGNNVALISAQNGIPWWYFQGLEGPYAGRVLESVDPGGTVARAINPSCILGCSIYCSTEIVRPGVIRHVEGNRFVIGEPSGEVSQRSHAISELFRAGELKCSVSNDIRTQIWIKAIGNVAFNPVSALTRASLGQMGSSAELRHVLRSIMEEASEVAAALGVTIPLSIDRRLEGGLAVGDHRTSMLQDLEQGKPLEIDSLTGAVMELALMLGISVPHLETVHAAVDTLSRVIHEVP